MPSDLLLLYHYITGVKAREQILLSLPFLMVHNRYTIEYEFFFQISCPALLSISSISKEATQGEKEDSAKRSNASKCSLGLDNTCISRGSKACSSIWGRGVVTAFPLPIQKNQRKHRGPQRPLKNTLGVSQFTAASFVAPKYLLTWTWSF